jgi:hypothetical protein
MSARSPPFRFAEVNAMSNDELRYPIGRFEHAGEITPEQRAQWIEEIATLPSRLRAAVAGFTETQWETPYRPGGWTVRQVVHHLPDSHMQAYVRFKLALTEEHPTIRPYLEAGWAELPDRATPPEVSLTLLDALHQRWTVLLRAMTPRDFQRTLFHPERDRSFTLDEMLGLYAWHGRHHLAHVEKCTG